MDNEYPYRECKKCKTLTDCEHVDVIDDGLSTPLPPEDCPRFNKVMAQTEKRRRKYARDIK